MQQSNIIPYYAILIGRLAYYFCVAVLNLVLLFYTSQKWHNIYQILSHTLSFCKDTTPAILYPVKGRSTHGIRVRVSSFGIVTIILSIHRYWKQQERKGKSCPRGAQACSLLIPHCYNGYCLNNVLPCYCSFFCFFLVRF